MGRASRPKTRMEFFKYCLRQVTGSVNEIELHDDDIDDIINDVMSDFQEYHRDGSTTRFMALRREHGQTEWRLPENVLGVVRVLHGRFSYLFHGGNSDVHLMFSNHGTAGFSSGNPDGQTLSAYYIMEQHYQQIRQTLVANASFDFNFVEGIFRLRSPLPPSGNTLQALPNYIVIEVESAVDEDTNPRIYSHRWVREYAIAKIGLLWSLGMLKYDSNFSDGSKLNSRDLQMFYQGEVSRLRDEAEETGMIAEPFIYQ